jgi:hypothetical protein
MSISFAEMLISIYSNKNEIPQNEGAIPSYSNKTKISPNEMLKSIMKDFIQNINTVFLTIYALIV